jgi:hypothetical protein
MANAKSNIQATEASSILIRSIRHIMRPVIRLMMRHGIVLQTFNELVKSVFTEEAEKEIAASGGLATDLQISLMTGIHRKEVKRFREEGYESFILSQTLGTGADVVTRWLTDKRFLSGRREPKALTTRRGEHEDSFSALIRAVDSELRPNAVLAEMVRLGVVHVKDEWAYLVVDAFVPQKGFDDQVQYLAENGHDYLATVVHNLGQPKAPMLEQSLSAHGLSAASAEELERTARNLWKMVMQQVMERAIDLEASDKAAGASDSRINFGVYFYNESLPKPEAPDKSKRTGGRKSTKR